MSQDKVSLGGSPTINVTLITTITTITIITISIPGPVDSLAAVLRGEVLVSQLAPAQADDDHLSREI